MSDKQTIVQAAATAITKELAAKGMIIEGGWRAYVILGGLENASQVQRDETRKAYYAGAQHLFASILSVLDPGEDTTDADMKRMSLINEELDRWVQSMKQSN
jgi:hypothetical protein